jgi:hypothetical protein
MAALELLAAALLVILLAVLAWRRASAGRSTLHNGVTEAQARENAAPLTTAILSGSRTRERDQR